MLRPIAYGRPRWIAGLDEAIRAAQSDMGFVRAVSSTEFADGGFVVVGEGVVAGELLGAFLG